MAEDWSRPEVELIVTEYFRMLMKEQSGISYSKTESRRAVQPLLQNRSEGSVEFKHQNISAVLAKINQPYINGYKPRWNYQQLLEEVVLERLSRDKGIEESFKLFAETVPPIQQLDFETILEGKPEPQPQTASEPDITYRSPIKRNYILLEQENASIGKRGEQIALDFEKWRLIKEGNDKFVNKVEWVSDTQGDGLGFDILSRNSNGTDRYIEVKTTKLSKEAPIFFSSNEYEFSTRNHANYYLYRVFNLKSAPKIFIANGKFDNFCKVKPVGYKGYF